MAGRKYFCTKCNFGVLIKEGEKPPDVCPNPVCQSPTWRCASTPAKPYELNANDKRFLKSLRIASDDER